MTDRRRRKKTRHHRKPRFFGASPSRTNITVVPEHEHRAFHLLFAWGYPAKIVAQVLNAKWLAHEEVLIPVPIGLVRKTLRFLRALGHTIHEEDLGITAAHNELRGHRRPPQKHVRR